ncbi:hypothetical protein PG988_003125 [Apiospora saccharicola]
MAQNPMEVIAQRAPDIRQELQKEIRAATQQQIDTMVVFQARLEAQARAVELIIGNLNRFVAVNNSGFIDLHPETVAVTSQHSPRGTEVPEDNLIDIATIIRSQTLEQNAQGITIRKQGYRGESPEPMGKGKIEETAVKNIALNGLYRRRQATLIFLRINKSLRTWSRSFFVREIPSCTGPDTVSNNRLYDPVINTEQLQPLLIRDLLFTSFQSVFKISSQLVQSEQNG